MRGKKELLMLIVSPVLFIADVVLDINVAIDHWRQGDIWLWFLTTTLIIVPFLITNIVAVIQMCVAHADREPCIVHS
jgi:ABC-type transport system involved in Fe-S cluster assembly fused permease/ATPase subunit